MFMSLHLERQVVQRYNHVCVESISALANRINSSFIITYVRNSRECCGIECGPRGDGRQTQMGFLLCLCCQVNGSIMEDAFQDARILLGLFVGMPFMIS